MDCRRDAAPVSCAVGAFLIGIALSGRVAEEARSLLSPLRDLFAAVFFVFFGLQTDPSGIPPVLPAALLLGAVTAITKIGTGWWAARRAGIGFLGRVRAGTVIVARGEFNIVIAGLAVSAEPRVGPLAAAYVLLMAVAGPIIARVAVPVASYVLRHKPVTSTAGAPAIAPEATPRVEPDASEGD